MMGVNGYNLLDIIAKDRLGLMLAAHTLSADNFVKRKTRCYVPKIRYRRQKAFSKILEAGEKGIKKLGKWFARLELFFEEGFGLLSEREEEPGSLGEVLIA